MKFTFNERKASQAAAHILRRHDGRFDFMHLIKLLYLADRMSLLERGVPITGDVMVSMHFGPVLGTVYDRIKSASPDSVWAHLIARDRYDIIFASTCMTDADDALSEYEMAALDTVDGRFGQMHVWNFIDDHALTPEWKDPGKDRTARIDPEWVLTAGGADAEHIERARRAAEGDAFFASL